MRSRRPLLSATLGVFLTGLVASCGEESTGTAETQVVASTTHVADLARNVAGERAEVVGLLAPNGDPHDYEPRPTDAQAIADADLVLQSGGELDVWSEDLVDSAGGAAGVVSLFGFVETVEGGHGHAEVEGHAEDEEHGEEDAHAGEADHIEEDHDHGGEDPHWWQDPANAVSAVETIRDELIAADPGGEEIYRENAAAYVDELEELDREIADCMRAVPAEQRKLVTTHDAFGYLAEAYDLEVIGAAIPALSTQAQPSAGETAALIELIEEEEVRAIFPEQGLTPQLEQAIADETGATVGAELWADTLGPEGSTGETYIQAMAHNAEAMVQGFTGGADDCAVEVGES